MFLSKPMLGTQLDWSNPLNDGLVLDLLMNEGHGDRVNDLSGWGNHGTLHGFDFPPTVASGWNPGMDGVGLNFDGTDDYIDCGSGSNLDMYGKTQWTFFFQIYAKTGDDYNRIFEKTGAAAPCRFTLKDGNATHAKLRLDMSNSTTPAEAITGLTISLNRGHNVIGTYNEDSDQRIKLYVDAVLQTLETDTAGVGALEDDSSGKLFIGTRSGEDFFFEGAIARARILPRAMSAFEVMQTQINPYGVYLR